MQSVLHRLATALPPAAGVIGSMILSAALEAFNRPALQSSVARVSMQRLPSNWKDTMNQVNCTLPTITLLARFIPQRVLPGPAPRPST